MGLHQGVVGYALQCEIEELPDTLSDLPLSPGHAGLYAFRALPVPDLWLSYDCSLHTGIGAAPASNTQIAGRSQPGQSAIGIGPPEAKTR